MHKVDLYKQFTSEYKASPAPQILKIGKAIYLAIDGAGAPGTPDFARRIGALYNMAFTIKMALKKSGQDYAVCKLEALWWMKDDQPIDSARPQDWRYTLLIRTPDFVTERHRKDAMQHLIEKNKPGEVVEVRLMKLSEGTCVQALHIGPYDAEQPTIARMQELAKERKLYPRGRHHEIYLSDPRRVSPEKLKTILRQPVE